MDPSSAAACAGRSGVGSTWFRGQVMQAKLLRHLEDSAAEGRRLCVWDPFCGKGTMLLEALGIAMGVPPASPVPSRSLASCLLGADLSIVRLSYVEFVGHMLMRTITSKRTIYMLYSIAS